MPRKGECMDLTGQKFGRWTVIERSIPRYNKKGGVEGMWRCICDCGTERIVLQASLINGKSKSCGCLNREITSSKLKKHGYSNSNCNLYSIWNGIKYRCYCENSEDYKNYGGRGIIVCSEWLRDFKAFYDWSIDNGYKNEKGDNGINILTLDRIDTNGNYEPSNCRWVTNKIQAQNKRMTMTDEERFKVCPICGKKFKVLKRNEKKTCSYKCGFIFREQNKTKPKFKTSKCPICGKEFRKRKYRGKDQKYCSTRCAGIGKSPIWKYNGETLRVVEWEEKTGINAKCLLNRMNVGWDIEKILTTPIRRKRGGEIDNT